MRTHGLLGACFVHVFALVAVLPGPARGDAPYCAGEWESPSPGSIAVSVAGDVYVTSLVAPGAAGQIHVYSRDGALERVIDGSGVCGEDFGGTAALAIGSNSDLYTCNSYPSPGCSYVTHMDSLGNVLGTFPTSGDGQGPCDIAVTPSGEIYISDIHHQLIVHYGADGSPLDSISTAPWGEPNTPFEKPYALTIAPNGLLWVCSDAGLRKVHPDGTLLASFPWPDAGGAGEGIGIDRAGRVFVANGVGNSYLNAIWEFDTTGTFVEGWRSWQSRSPGMFLSVRDVASTSQGDVYVTDIDSVFHFTPIPAAVDGRTGASGLALRLERNPVGGADAWSFRIELPETMPVSLAVFDASGRRLARIEDGTLPSGVSRLRWTPPAAGLRPGVMFARLHTDAGDRVERVVHLE